MTCAICKIRRPRRYCPGIGGDICSICCGTEREVTVDCPLDCEYLQESRARQKQPIVSADDFPNQDIRITDKFLAEHETLLLFLATNTLAAAMDAHAIDYDIREALDALIRTHRTLNTGLIYETRPVNPMAARVFSRVQDSVAELRKHLQQSTGISGPRDAEVLGIIIFLQRLEIQHNNGRGRGRAFIDFLRHYLPERPAETLVTA